MEAERNETTKVLATQWRTWMLLRSLDFFFFFFLINETPLKDFKQRFKCQKNHYNINAKDELAIEVE